HTIADPAKVGHVMSVAADHGSDRRGDDRLVCWQGSRITVPGYAHRAFLIGENNRALPNHHPVKRKAEANE
ncbi:MAG TPA: hypothetical protein PLJ27_05135, partial [Polyangiaceae bacterium]|nr:hypothetical protein [Polyangiaceae bacterium]